MSMGPGLWIQAGKQASRTRQQPGPEMLPPQVAPPYQAVADLNTIEGSGKGGWAPLY